MRYASVFLAVTLLLSVAIAGPEEIIPPEPVELVPGTELGEPVIFPNMSIDELDAGYILQHMAGSVSGPSGWGSYSMGFRFTPLKPGMITRLGRWRGAQSDVSTIKVWSSAGAELASMSVSGSEWSYEDITPLMVTPGNEYWVTTYGGSSVYRLNMSPAPPQEVNDIRVLNGGFILADAMPTSSSGATIYGMTDFYFDPVPHTWTGAVSGDWNTPENWNFSAVPTTADDAVIPSGLSTYPSTNSGPNYAAANLTIEAGASLTVVEGKVFGLMGDLVNDGSLSAQAGSGFEFLGEEDSEISVGVGGSLAFFNVYLDKSGPLAMFGGGDPTGGSGSTSIADWTVVMLMDPAQYDGPLVMWEARNASTANRPIKIKVFRPDYNGFQFYMVGEGKQFRDVFNVPVTYIEDTIHGVQAGDLLGAACIGGIFRQSVTCPGFHYLVGDVGSANGWNLMVNSWPKVRAWQQSTPDGVEVTTAGDIDINGELVIPEGHIFNSSAGEITFKGDITNDAEFEVEGAAVFDGTTALFGSGMFEFNDVFITGELTAGDEMFVYGDWNCTGTFNPNGGYVWFGGSNIAGGAFFDLEVNNIFDGDVTVLADFAVENALDVTAGNLLLGTNTLTLGTESASGSVNVQAGFSVVGTEESERGMVTAAVTQHPFDFTVHGGIASRYAAFRWVGVNGVDVRATATIDATDNFSFTSFTPGVDVGSMLKIANDQVIEDMEWVDFFGNQGFNIDYSAGSGHLTITDGDGDRWGEDFEIDPNDLVDWEVSTFRDVGMTAILAPTGTAYLGVTYFPRVRIKNYGEIPEPEVPVRVTITGPLDVVYDHVETVALELDEEKQVIFTVAWEPEELTELGEYEVLARTEMPGDRNSDNDEMLGEVTVEEAPPFDPGWVEVAPMPHNVGDRRDRVRRGSWLAFNEGDGLIYATKGNKRQDFFAYDAVQDTWAELAPAPLDPTRGRPLERGCRGVADGDNTIYMVHGNNTLAFWKYDIEGDTWTALTDVPEGPSRRRVRGGGYMVYMVREDTGYVYLLKGDRTEFFRYNTETGNWEQLADAPMGIRPRWMRDSWLAYDGDNAIFAHKARYFQRGAAHEAHELWQYDVAGDSWIEAVENELAGMPLLGLHGGRIRRRRARDGGSGVYDNGFIYALKGGNSQQFWTYEVAADTWVEADTIPTWSPTTGRRRRMNAGSYLERYGPNVFFALKGNRTAEFWRYVIPVGEPTAQRPERSGVMAGHTAQPVGISVTPSLVTGNSATLRYSLAKPGPVSVNVYDVTGRSVLSRSLVASRTGAVSLDMRSLSAGIYLVKVEADGFTGTRKLVVQR